MKIVKPTVVLKDKDGDELSVWPPLPGATDLPVVQIDHEDIHVAFEYTKAEASRLAAAILAAADELD